MTTGTKKGKPVPPKADAKVSPPTRHVFGPRAISAILPPVVQPALRKRAPAVAALLADWQVIMGPALAAVTTPRKLFQGCLAIACTGPIAMELQHLAPTLMSRINTHLGQVAVTRLRFVPDTVAAASLPPVRVPNTEAAGLAVAGLPPGKLRDALAALGAAVLSTSPHHRR